MIWLVLLWVFSILAIGLTLAAFLVFAWYCSTNGGRGY